MTGFLFDENLPRRITFTPSLPTQHATELGKNPSDHELWEHARRYDLAIVTKDHDFVQRIDFADPPPRVVLLAFGNLHRTAYHALLARVWPQFERLLLAHKLVIVHDNGLASAA